METALKLITLPFPPSTTFAAPLSLFPPPKAFPPRGILPAECRQSSTTRSLHFAKIIDEASSERSQLGPVLGSSHDLFCTSY